MSDTVTFRPFKPGDAASVLEVFQSSVLAATSPHYTQEQAQAWASLRTDAATFVEDAQDGRYFLLAMHGQRVVGYANVTREGYLDHLYVASSHVNRGIGTDLLIRLHDWAYGQRIRQLTTDASLVARPLFERFGFVVARRQSVKVANLSLTNFRMSRVLDPGDASGLAAVSC